MHVDIDKMGGLRVKFNLKIRNYNKALIYNTLTARRRLGPTGEGWGRRKYDIKCLETLEICVEVRNQCETLAPNSLQVFLHLKDYL